ncbi:MAG: hypothetical protein GC179_27650 [Anaerolineaceae bacterium]|nr:hypothetical protein [Anaerolineaceae bacterium]
MGFNRNDLQGDDDDFNFDDDDFKFDDQPNGDDFKFDDDAPDIDLDSGTDTGFGFESEDMPELNEEGTAPARTNRTFVYIAALMIILFLIGLGAVLFLATRDTGPTSGQLTATSIVATNNAVEVLLNMTNTAAVEIAFAQTQTANAPTATPTATSTPTELPTYTPTPTEPPLDATQLAANALLTQVASDATGTALAAQITPTVAAPNQSAVDATGTALAILLGQSGGGATEVAGVPTQEIVNVVPTRLPQSGFFDDVGSGSNVGLIALLALGLFGVIGVSRMVRAANK